MSSDAVLVEGLTRRFGTLTAVDRLSFSTARGELFGLLGPDGAGKTTTLRMLAGVLRPSAGDARIDGVSVLREPEQVKHRIAYMSQRFGLYADLTVLENIEFYADLYRVPRAERPARYQRLFQFSNLGPFKDRLAGKLSGGMKQKLGLSCALVHEPEVLLLDEPTFGVDPVSRRELWLIVHEMVGKGTTAIVSTAYMDEAERFDRVALVHQGRLLALGAPEELQRGISGSVLQAQVGEKTREARRAMLSVPGVRTATAFGDRLHLALDTGGPGLHRIEAALRGAGVPAPQLQAIEPSMEDVFVDQIARAGQA